MRRMNWKAFVAGGILMAGFTATPVGPVRAIDATFVQTFGGSGSVTVNLGAGDDRASALAVQTDGRIVVAGSVTVSSRLQTGVARFNADGSLDTGFDGDGKFVSTMWVGNNVPAAVAIQTDGKIVMAGERLGSAYVEPYLVRLNADGTPDTAFDSDGYVERAFGSGNASAFGMVLQPDGRIVVVGYLTGTAEDIMVMRYNTDGSPDTTFDGDGVASVDVNGSDIGGAVAVQADGRIVVAASTNYSVAGDVSLIRFTAAGALDTSFGTGGTTTTSFGTGRDIPNSVSVRSDGRIVAAGNASGGQAAGGFIVQLTPTGSFDTSFDGDGRMSLASITDFTVGGSILDSAGRLLVAGHKVVGGNGDFAMLLLRPNGNRESRFATDGFLVAPIGTLWDQDSKVAVKPDGTVAVMTSQYQSSRHRWGLAVLNALPAPQSTDSTLASVVLSKGSLVPSFAPSTVSYSGTVPNGTRSITVAPTRSNAAATMTMNSTTLTSGVASGPVSLAPGRNSIPVVVTAEDGSATTYTIVVTRDVATVRRGRTITAKSVMQSVDRTIPREATVAVAVKKSTRTKCSVTGTTVKGLKIGTCTVVVSVKPKATKSAPHPRSTRTTVSLRVVR